MEAELLETIMGLIMYGGDAKGKAVEAIAAAKKFNFEVAEAKLKEANLSLSHAHKSQTALLTQEAGGDSINISLLMVHGQDHLMNAITFIDMAKEVIDIYRQLDTMRG
ncbi:PTS lactose/cellobiose transporter subunit IIA [Streptococcus gallolyticus]|nr:PTS lactose/cellobiose transporter subunit IIA [Streptococcus gallolyticus]MBY5041573.1 PTS lactose/cellobiose transporter subunit IIA [Streptococcus gallolyticus]